MKSLDPILSTMKNKMVTSGTEVCSSVVEGVLSVCRVLSLIHQRKERETERERGREREKQRQRQKQTEIEREREREEERRESSVHLTYIYCTPVFLVHTVYTSVVS